MQLMICKRVARVILVALLSVLAVVAQNVRVEVGKNTRRIPKGCETVVPASIDGLLDVPALVNEAICKGAGDMLTEYSYTLKSDRRLKNKKGEIKESTTTYEVFIPTLKSGARARGILVVTSRDGVPVPPDELEKERRKAGERLEKEEARIEREAPSPPPAEDTTKGMLPIGMYSRMAVHRSVFGVSHGAALAIHTFLQTCELTLLRRASNEGREIMVFTFIPRPDAQFNDEEKYIAQLKGEIWIDVQDRIVTRLVGWPANQDTTKNVDLPSADEKSPAVSVDMMRLKEGIWLPRKARINAADYPKLFDGITQDSTSTYSNHVRFSTEIKDVKVNPPENP